MSFPGTLKKLKKIVKAVTGHTGAALILYSKP
jgi:hypothetical protein|uniref:Uncharacterized protein n=1 Tax=Siphoviridae sp. ctwHj1 TaxID=2825727 RepID=A0A8S5U655_9CAUD|nr:MAG TPA: hypothetical protein [Siphoviridae sp. ctwHj1]